MLYCLGYVTYHSCQGCVCMCVQRETLLRQLETNQLDMDATLEELSVQQETEDQNYEMYCLLYSLCQCMVVKIP